ncbi:serine/threonine-protein kinase [Paenibacillus sp. CF384]|uniref:serine/threonine protein kinase n=1 Tax=Paenibacillus sp. CF384 TaxID=1884382 RepID=UPI00089643C4|nr:serine/threonine-protein kinase [Paenibacillus sp. CF384]SDX77663.1 serine/threonine protein kinase [Paenibacillus sp. CF384]
MSTANENQDLLKDGIMIGGRYRIVGLIGRGGMGEVYAAEDLRLHGKLRALKVASIHKLGGVKGAEEAELLMRLNHPHLPLIVDYFPRVEELDCEVVVMDYIDGNTLQAYLASRGGDIRFTDILEIGSQLCEALHYLHSQHPPIIHRDLKPTNVMIDRGGFVRLIDFGIAREYKRGKAQDTVMLGTPGFAAPEQEGEYQSDARTDVFGLGALLYYMLSGGNRYITKEGPAPRRLHTLPHDLPIKLTEVIYRMLDPNPVCRYSSMMEAKHALEACLGNEPAASHHISGPTVPIPSNRRRTIMVASLSPGAGATFTTITLAHLLEQRGILCTAIEHPVVEPEWHALLYTPEVQKRLQSKSQQAWLSKYRSFHSPSQHTKWHALEPDSRYAADAEPTLKYRLLSESTNSSVILTDISSKWTNASELTLELTQSDALLFVVDPSPFKWTPQRLQEAERICFERSKAGLRTYWVANKDMTFRNRSEWLAAIPEKPACSVPMLPADQLAELLWSGKWATSHKNWLSLLERAFQPILQEIVPLSRHIPSHPVIQ